jgi:hypothetical protein
MDIFEIEDFDILESVKNWYFGNTWKKTFIRENIV